MIEEAGERRTSPAALVGLAFLLLIVVLAIRDVSPPDPRPATIAESEFSAVRAHGHTYALDADSGEAVWATP